MQMATNSQARRLGRWAIRVTAIAVVSALFGVGSARAAKPKDIACPHEITNCGCVITTAGIYESRG